MASMGLQNGGRSKQNITQLMEVGFSKFIYEKMACGF